MISNFKDLYKNDADIQKERYKELKDGFKNQFGSDENIQYFSAPGRTEIGGNHTDHNHGRVLTAAVNLDIIVAANKTDDNKVYLKSAEYPDLDIIELSDLEPKESEKETSFSLIKGICSRCRELGYNVGGFKAYTMTNVLKGSGLSSSAAFEVAIVTVISHLFNNDSIDPVETAKIAQYAENVYFGKPSGLLDQMSSSVGSVISIDFADTANPVIEKIELDLDTYKHALCIVDTGGNHADLTDEYAYIPQEMKRISSFFGKEYLREVDENEFYSNIRELRKTAGDRAVLRAIHFFDDNNIAHEEAVAIKNGDFDKFKSLILKSGHSSATRLQNVFSVKSIEEQGLSLGLAVSEKILDGKGAYRVHGGGFAGTIQAFVPYELLDEYKTKIENIFGKGSCYVLSTRNAGGTKVSL